MRLSEALAQRPIIAILRGVQCQEAVDIGRALFDAGIRAMEIPLNSPEPLRSIAALVDSFGDRMTIGAGTVLQPADVDRVHDVGGRLIVSPNVDAAVIERTLELSLDAAPGFATASEAFTAIRAGASVLKLFPACTYGPRHLSALKAVLPASVRVLAVGGVGASDFAAWREAGAGGFGLGSELYRPGDDAAQVARAARTAVSALD